MILPKSIEIPLEPLDCLVVVGGNNEPRSLRAYQIHHLYLTRGIPLYLIPAGSHSGAFYGKELPRGMVPEYQHITDLLIRSGVDRQRIVHPVTDARDTIEVYFLLSDSLDKLAEDLGKDRLRYGNVTEAFHQKRCMEMHHLCIGGRHDFSPVVVEQGSSRTERLQRLVQETVIGSALKFDLRKNRVVSGRRDALRIDRNALKEYMRTRHPFHAGGDVYRPDFNAYPLIARLARRMSAFLI